MARLIDADKLKLAIRDDAEINGSNYARMKMHINEAETVDAVEVVHGEWSTIEDDYCGLPALQCSECNQEYWFEEEPPIKIYNYCPNCGAKMDGGAKNAQT